MRFPRQEYWNGLPSLSIGDLPDPGIEPASPALAGGFFTTEPPGKPWRGGISAKWLTGFTSSYGRQLHGNWVNKLHESTYFQQVHRQAFFILVWYQIRSVAQSCPTLCDPMNRSTPGLPVHHQLPEFTETHVHRVSDAIQPSHPLSSPSPPAPNPSQHQSLFQWVNSSHEVAKVLEFQL